MNGKVLLAILVLSLTITSASATVTLSNPHVNFPFYYSPDMNLVYTAEDENFCISFNLDTDENICVRSVIFGNLNGDWGTTTGTGCNYYHVDANSLLSITCCKDINFENTVNDPYKSQPNSFIVKIGTDENCDVIFLQEWWYVDSNGAEDFTTTGTYMLWLDFNGPDINADPDSLPDWSNKADVNLFASDKRSGVSDLNWEVIPAGETCSSYSNHTTNSSVDVNLPDGNWMICAWARDNVGNESYATFGPYAVDTTAPMVTVVSDKPYVRSGEEITLDINVERENLVTFDGTVHVDCSSIGGFEGDITLSWNEGIWTGRVSCTVDSNLADGDYNIKVTATDKAGNTGEGITTVTVDNTPPEVEITSPSDGALVGSRDINVVWDYNEEHLAHWYVDCNGDNTPEGEGTSGNSYVCQYTSDGDYNIKVILIDLADNNGFDTVSVTVDATPPTVSDVNVIGTYEDYVKNGETVKVEFNVSDAHFDHATVDFRSVGGNVVDANCSGGHCSAESIVNASSGDHNIIITAYDEAGNSSSETATVKVDNDAPTVSFNPSSSSWTNQNIDVTISADDGDGSGVSKIYYYVTAKDSNCPPAGDGNYQSENSPTASVAISEEGEWKICAYAEDNLGNTPDTPQESGIYQIDKTEPSVSFDYGVYTPGTWSNSYVTITVSVDDFLSGVKTKKYYIQNVGVDCPTGLDPYSDLPDSGEVTVGDDGKWKVCVYAEDNAGNSKFMASDEIWVDTIPPDVTITSPSDGESFASHNVNVTWNATDGTSGISRVIVDCDYDGSPELDTTGNPGTYTCQYASDGEYDITVGVYDAAGNYSEDYAEMILVDTTPPDLEVSPETRDWSTQDVNVDLSITDDGSGPAAIHYIVIPYDQDCPASGYTTVNGYSTTVSITESGEWGICVYGEDNLGNLGTPEKHGPYRIDKVPPTTWTDTHGYVPGTWVNHRVDVDIYASDEHSGVRMLHYGYVGLNQDCSTDIGTWSSHASISIDPMGGVSTGKVCYYAEDNVGLTSDMNSVIVRVDEENPNIVSVDWHGYGGEWVNHDVVVDVNVLDGGEIDYVRVEEDGNVLADCTLQFGLYHCVISDQGDHSVVIAAQDKAGNRSESSQYPVRIDKSLPDGQIVEPGDYVNYVNSLVVDVNVHATDDLSGVASVRANVDGGAWTDLSQDGEYWTGDVNLGSEGRHTINIEVTDVAGNTKHMIKQITVDLTSPVVTITGPDEGYVTTNGTVHVTWDYNEENYDHSEVDCDSDGSPEYTGSDTSYDCVYADNGDYTVTVTVYDKAGNSGSAQRKVYARLGAIVITVDNSAYMGFEEKPVKGWESILEGKKVKIFTFENGMWKEVTEVKGLYGYYVSSREEGTVYIPFWYAGDPEPVELGEGWNLISVTDQAWVNDDGHRYAYSDPQNQSSLHTIWSSFDVMVDPVTRESRTKDQLADWVTDFHAYWIHMTGSGTYNAYGQIPW